MSEWLEYIPDKRKLVRHQGSVLSAGKTCDLYSFNRFFTISALTMIPFLLSLESIVGAVEEGGFLPPDHQVIIESTRFSDE